MKTYNLNTFIGRLKCGKEAELRFCEKLDEFEMSYIYWEVGKNCTPVENLINGDVEIFFENGKSFKVDVKASTNCTYRSAINFEGDYFACGNKGNFELISSRVVKAYMQKAKESKNLVPFRSGDLGCNLRGIKPRKTFKLSKFIERIKNGQVCWTKGRVNPKWTDW